MRADYSAVLGVFPGDLVATPRLCGRCVLGQHPGWSAWQVRSAIVNTADPNVFDGGAAAPRRIMSVNAIGSRSGPGRGSRCQVRSSGQRSFGAVPSGSGRADTTARGCRRSVPRRAYAVEDETCAGVNFGATLEHVTSMREQGDSLAGLRRASCVFAGATEIAHAAVYALVK